MEPEYLQWMRDNQPERYAELVKDLDRYYQEGLRVGKAERDKLLEQAQLRETDFWRGEQELAIMAEKMAGLQEERDKLRGVIWKVICDLAALVSDPKNPDWIPALSSSNKADAHCLQDAYDRLYAALEEKP